MALSLAYLFIKFLIIYNRMFFVKRDLILLVGVLLFMLGLLPFLAPIYAVIIAIGIFFGIKLFVKNRQKFLENQIGDGFSGVWRKVIKKNVQIVIKLIIPYDFFVGLIYISTEI